MEGIVSAVTAFAGELSSVSDGMKGIFAALVALALLGLLFSRIGK